MMTIHDERGGGGMLVKNHIKIDDVFYGRPKSTYGYEIITNTDTNRTGKTAATKKSND